MSGVSSRLQTAVESRLKMIADTRSLVSVAAGGSPISPVSAQGLAVQNVHIQTPFRGGDVSRRIFNIDSRFRQNPDTSTTSNFSIRLVNPIKNAVRVRVVSIEIPNNYHFFNSDRKNVTIAIEYGTGYETRKLITIDSGNYIASEMEHELNTKLSEANIKWLTVSWDNIQGFFCFTGTQDFRLNTAIEEGTLVFNRKFDYGLGFYLGFQYGKKGGVYDGKEYWTTCSDFYANFAGDNYLLLSVNEFNCVQHQMDNGSRNILGKIILREPKNYMVFDDYTSQIAKESIFIAPVSLDTLDIQILDPYCNPVNFQNANVSLSFEVVEIANLSVFNAIRDGMLSSF
jgi:hypothetical protein